MTRIGPRQNPQMSPTVRAQIKDCYAVMDASADWRPYAGSGSLTSEANEYARTWFRDEGDSAYDIGRPDHETRPALIFAVEAARAARLGRRAEALDLLELARIELAP